MKAAYVGIDLLFPALSDRRNDERRMRHHVCSFDSHMHILLQYDDFGLYIGNYIISFVSFSFHQFRLKSVSGRACIV